MTTRLISVLMHLLRGFDSKLDFLEQTNFFIIRSFSRRIFIGHTYVDALVNKLYCTLVRAKSVRHITLVLMTWKRPVRFLLYLNAAYQV